jgi:hypothetical protein
MNKGAAPAGGQEFVFDVRKGGRRLSASKAGLTKSATSDNLQKLAH